MGKQEDRFQEKLEQLRAGEPLEVCQAGLPQDEADLLALVVQLGKVHYPERDENVVTEQRVQLLKLAAKEQKMKTQSPEKTPKRSTRSLPKWFVPVTALSGGVILLFICVIVVLLGAGAAWRAFRDADAVQSRSSTATPGTSATQGLSPLTTI